MTPGRQSLPRVGWEERVVGDDSLAGSDDLWADEDFDRPARAPMLVPHPDSVSFYRAFLLAAAVSLVLWLVLAALGFGVYRLVG